MDININVDTYNSSLCGKSYLRNEDFISHMTMHTSGNSPTNNGQTGEMPYLCHLCEKPILTMSEMNIHMMNHTGEEPYKCSQSEDSFSKYCDLQKHNDIHLKINSFKCNQSNESLLTESNMSINMSKHTGNMLYPCIKCEKSYSRHSDLKKHMKTHIGEKPYQCNHCDKSFLAEATFFSNQETVHGYSTHKCKQCEKTLVQMSLCNCADKPHKCRKCERNFSQINLCHNSENKPKSDITGLNDSFKGLRFINPQGHNLCYVNATVNSLLNCRNALNVVKSDLECVVIKKIKFWVNSSDATCSTRSLRDLLIGNNFKQFLNYAQSDPDDFIRCLFEISEPLKNLFKFEMLTSYECQKCFDKSYNNVEHFFGLNEAIKGTSIVDIIRNNRETSVESFCNICNTNVTKTKKESFTSSPEILMIQLQRFVSHNADGTAHYDKDDAYIDHQKDITVNNVKYSLRSIIGHYGQTPYQGHYTVSLLDNHGTWIECNDTEINKIDTPKEGYIYLYEKSTENLSLKKAYQCIPCDQPFSKSIDHINHVNAHTGRAYQCSICDQAFSSNFNLIRHIATHSAHKQIKCNQCNKMFLTESEKISHTKTHDDKGTFECRPCVMNFSSNVSKVSHMKKHIRKKNSNAFIVIRHSYQMGVLCTI